MKHLKKPHWQILIALIAAVIAGAWLRTVPTESAVHQGFITGSKFVGDIFMNALKMIIVPLVVSSIISGIGGVGKVEGFARLGGKTLLLYTLSSLIAVCIGLTAVNTLKPGLEDGKPNTTIKAAIEQEAANLEDAGASKEKLERVEQAKKDGFAPIADIFKRMFPPNIILAASQGQMLGLIVFSILFGIAMTRLDGSMGQTMQHVIQGVNDIMITLTHWVMLAAPIGVFGLVTPTIAAAGGEIFYALGRYFVTVLAALATHFLVAMPLLLLLLARVDPVRHFRAMRDALLTAFSTASSSATLPVTMECVQENAKVSQRVSSFTLPLGATVNMDGTALYECVAVMFIAQVLGYDFTLATQFSIVLLALLTSIGVAGVPSASLVAIVVIMQSVDIKGAEAAIAVLFSVDRLLDMSRTAVNVFGDSCAAVIIGKSEGESQILKDESAL
ncbi:dicarboxylate/amino acid:cation symporter [Sulfuriroseicoccus oceanibius]|uniref:Dicarboxylate/amino acid:cation symporter n=1 Tax=Sulfuriroseicoccus oceanibius TaxID=2707525 RepID=A0A6B3L744_9BACT|nr:dicarboxylate/amino acid:cation symporter [Sulfuriroseicoccus oceanibius]QQL43877.1 dicarboxylate/amino acid:cation symporter [Sulfuriroseicoccus oceanibius]